MGFDCAEGECRVGCMLVAEPASLVVERAIERQMRVHTRVAVKDFCALGKLAEIVQIGGERHSRRCIHQWVRHSVLP